MAVEINGTVVEHDKPTKYAQLVFEHKQKVEQLKVLQKEIYEISAILDVVDRSVQNNDGIYETMGCAPGDIGTRNHTLTIDEIPSLKDAYFKRTGKSVVDVCDHIWVLSAETKSKPWYKISFYQPVCAKCGLKPIETK